jgi:flagellin-like hook-associated protein FlgL
MKKQQINDILNMIDGTIRSTTYNGKQILDGSMSYRTSGVDGSKLGNVAVSKATFDTAQGQTVDIALLEQARKGALKIDDIILSNPFDLQLIGKEGTMIELNGSSGSYTKDIMIDAINAKTSETGITARSHGTSIILETVDVGSNHSFTLVDLNDNMTITNMAGNAATSDTGRDVLVKINGQQVQGNGRDIQYNSGNLAMSATISQTFAVGTQTQFTIAGGALFQLGKDVQPSMQYRMALPSMTTSHLGGASGTLYDLRSIDLDTDEGKARAYSIINEAVNMVAVQRGTIGAVQKGVLDNSAKNLDIQLEKVSESEGLISNADMALESSRLNRAELLAQSAMSSILYSRMFNQFILNSLL